MIKVVLRILISIGIGCILLWPVMLPENWRAFAQSGIDPGKPKPKPKPKPASKPPVKPKPKSDDSKSGHGLTLDLGNGVSMEFVRIPAGSFQMGSTNGSDTETPVHKVTIGRSFYMGKFEVTQAQWQAVMGNNPSKFKDCGGNCPVEQVSWDDAQQFINLLNNRGDGKRYRLPSEAEWEYAARAGTTGDYAGNLDAMAWYANNSGKQVIDADSIIGTDSQHYGEKLTGNGNQMHAVGIKQANPWGLCDMHGNVWEWVRDWYHDNYSGAPIDGSAWESGGEQKYRVLRGGSWDNVAGRCRSANHDYLTPDARYDDIGLRVVVSAR